MQDNYKDIDSLFKAMLHDAEEEVPRHIMDNVFEQLDIAESKKRKVLPVWLRRMSSGIAVAAALLLAVLLWKDDDAAVKENDLTANIGKIEFRPGSQMEIHEPVDYVENTAIANRNAHETVRIPESLDHTAMESEDNENIEVNVSDNVVNDEDRQTNVSEDDVDNSTYQYIKEKEAKEPGSDNATDNAGKNDFPETANWDGKDNRERKNKIALLVGGDVSTNGNAKGLGRFGGFRAPSIGVQDKTWIEQSGKESSYAIPVTVGLGARFSFTKHWAIGTGVNYSLLQRTFSGIYTRIENGTTAEKISSDVRHTINYIGIPVNVYYTFVDIPKLKCYAYAGGTVEKGIQNSFRLKNSPEDIIMREKVKGVQASAGAGLGVEFMFTDNFGIYIDPSIRYYFDCGQPVSIRTQQPLMMNFEVGLRIDI